MSICAFSEESREKRWTRWIYVWKKVIIKVEENSSSKWTTTDREGGGKMENEKEFHLKTSARERVPHLILRSVLQHNESIGGLLINLLCGEQTAIGADCKRSLLFAAREEKSERNEMMMMKKTLTLERVIEHLRLFICSVAAVWGFWITFRVGNTQDTEMLLLLVGGSC